MIKINKYSIYIHFSKRDKVIHELYLIYLDWYITMDPGLNAPHTWEDPSLKIIFFFM